MDRDGRIFWAQRAACNSQTHAAAAKSLQSCPTLCDPIDGSPPGSFIPRILQARTLEWLAISFSNASKWKVKVKSLSRVRLFATPWTAAYQAPLFMGFSRQEWGVEWGAIAFSTNTCEEPPMDLTCLEWRVCAGKWKRGTETDKQEWIVSFSYWSLGHEGEDGMEMTSAF